MIPIIFHMHLKSISECLLKHIVSQALIFDKAAKYTVIQIFYAKVTGYNEISARYCLGVTPTVFLNIFIK